MQYQASVGERGVFMGRAMNMITSALFPSFLITSGLSIPSPEMISVGGFGHFKE
jgi:hypothetical protein